MKKLKTIAAVVALIATLGAVAYGDQRVNLTCPPPEPGQTDTPPCTTVNGPANDTTELGQTLTQSLADAVDATSTVEQALITFLLF